jgi:hypothetical protein
VTAQICPSCGSAATARYCSNCGERIFGATDAAQAPADRASEPAPSFAGRVRASVVALVSPPGRLTSDWMHGRRVGYLTPLSLFLWINVAFFLIQSVTGLGILSWPLRAHLAADESTRWITSWLFAHRPGRVAESGNYAEVFDALEAVHAKSLVIVMVPFFAAAVGALTIDRNRQLRHPLVFATHFFAFALLWLSMLFPVAALVFRLVAKSVLLAAGPHNLDLILTSLEAAGLAWYLYVALDTVFRLPRLRRSITVVVLVAALYVILSAYHVVVFAATLYST